jgi:hypothetical protein
MARQLQQADVTLPIKDILNANAAWVRTEWPNSSRLKRSIAAEGMHVPVLVNADWEVIDGARRVKAAEELGLERVPALVAHEWPAVVTYFQEIRELDKTDFPSAPMRWLELNDLIIRLLNPIFLPYTRAMGVMRRHQGLGLDPEVKAAAGRLHQGLNELLGVSGAKTTVAIVQIGRSLVRARKLNGAEFEKKLRDGVRQIEKTTGQVWSADLMVRTAIKLSKIPDLVSDERLAVEQTVKIGRILQVLEVGTSEIKTIGDLNVAIDMATAQEFVTKVRLVIKTSNALLRALNTHIEVVTSRETEQ